MIESVGFLKFLGGKMKITLTEEQMAKRVVREFSDGSYVNLGIGLPTLCASYLEPSKKVFFHAEHGVLGYGPTVTKDSWSEANFDYVDAGLRFFEKKDGMSFFDMSVSFSMIWGRHLDVSVLGAVEVSGDGDLANWTFGSVESGGIGGSMDLAIGAKKVIAMMQHLNKKGISKVVSKCNYPLTAKKCVDLIITDICVLEVSSNGLILREVAPGWSVEEVQSLTQPGLIIFDNVKVIDV